MGNVTVDQCNTLKICLVKICFEQKETVFKKRIPSPFFFQNKPTPHHVITTVWASLLAERVDALHDKQILPTAPLTVNQRLTFKLQTELLLRDNNKNNYNDDWQRQAVNSWCPKENKSSGDFSFLFFRWPDQAHHKKCSWSTFECQPIQRCWCRVQLHLILYSKKLTIITGITAGQE